jgi:hypothetical protein
LRRFDIRFAIRAIRTRIKLHSDVRELHFRFSFAHGVKEPM